MSTSFENSAMKSSFSLSSLRTAPSQAGGGRCDPMERPYHSLTKKRKEPCREAWRRSWGSAASGCSAGDDLWPLLQHHYDYIMDNQIIDSCKEANGELTHTGSTVPSLNAASSFNRQWSLRQLVAEFAELSQWLTHVQEEIYASAENLSSRRLRASRMSELVSAEPRRAKFVEQAAAILERIPEAGADVSWRLEHLNVKWEGLKLLLSPDKQQKDGDDCADTVDTAHELRCLRRWLHCMEGRLPPLSLATARAAPPHHLARKLREHQVLQRDVECHGRIVSSVVRLCGGGDAARALEQRWHLLYLRAIEWQCHLEACLARVDNKVSLTAEVSDSDEEPVLKHPRLSHRAPRTPPPPPPHPPPIHALPYTRAPATDTRDSCSEEEQEYVTVYCGEAWSTRHKMADERRVPAAPRAPASPPRSPRDQTVPAADHIDGHYDPDIHDVSVTLEDCKLKTPPTVIKRKKPINRSKFNQTDRKSKNCATFYFRHHDTDSDRQMIETEKSQEESSEEEWTYVGGKIANEDSTDIMTSSVEIQCELPLDDKVQERDESPNKEKILESSTPDLLRMENNARCKDIERLVIQAEELVQKQAQQQLAKHKTKGTRNFMPLTFEEEDKSSNRTKMSRIKEWLNQSSDGNNDHGQCGESYDASGEYTTESEVDTSLTSEERNLHSSMDMSTSTCTVTPTHQAKVQLRKKRAGSGSGARPWSVSCLSQLGGAGANGAGTGGAGGPGGGGGAGGGGGGKGAHMSISESALHTLTSPHRVASAISNSKLRGSSTTVQGGHVSSTNTMTEACTSCVEAGDRHCWLRRKRLRRGRGGRGAAGEEDRGAAGGGRGIGERLVKSLSFCGRLSPELVDRHERSAASDPPAASRKYRFDTTSTSGNDSDEDLLKHQQAIMSHLRRSIERTHISSGRDQDNAILEQTEPALMAPTFKLGPAGGPVRPRVARSMERERTLLGLSLGDPSQMYDLSMDKDSDVDKSVNTAGTEEHSSFSEQAWDFYQEKYNSEPYSEAPDSDAARRLLEFGDDYRAYFDSQSDCWSSLSAQPETDRSPNGTRRRRPPSEPRHKRLNVETPRKPRKKSLLDSLERSRIENEGIRRRKPSDKRSPDSCDLLNALTRRRHSSDEVNSSLEYSEVNNRPDILDSLGRRRGRDSSCPKRSDSGSSCPKRSDSGSSCPRKSDSEGSVIRRSTARLQAAEAMMTDTTLDYTDIVTWCRENISALDAALAAGLSPARQREIRAVSARWSALRAAATRRGGARRLRRELAALKETLDDVCEPGDAPPQPPQPHTKAQLLRRIEELKERLSRLLECKVSILKLTVSVRRALGELETDDSGLAADLSGLLAAWDGAHQRTSNELLSLEKAISAWAEWESALRELQTALRGDLATLQALRDRGATTPASAAHQGEIADQIKQLAASLVDKKKCGSTCDSLSDSGISDGDSEGAGGRARRLGALRELARRLQAALAPNSPAHRAIAKRMEQTENEVRTLQESCRALVEQTIPDLKVDDETKDRNVAVAGNKTGAGDPDYSPRGSWVWRVLRSSLPIQLCLVALLLAAWLVERPRCCDALNSLAQTLTPQLRYVRGPPPV